MEKDVDVHSMKDEKYVYGKPVFKYDKSEKLSYLYVMEDHKDTKSSTYVYVENSDGNIIHISKFANLMYKEGSFRYYEVKLQKLLPIRLYMFKASNKYVLPIEVYNISMNSQLAPQPEELDFDPSLSRKVSSGNKDIDDIINEIILLKGYWSKHFYVPKKRIEEVDKKEAYLRIALIAKHAYEYYRNGSLKLLWRKLTKEYQNFVVATLDEKLSSMGKSIKDSLLPSYLTHKATFSYSGRLCRYIINGKEVSIEIERKIDNAKPDIVISSNNRYLFIECKQGPRELWLKKAIKQANKYRIHADKIILISLRKIEEEDMTKLSKYYDLILDLYTPYSKDRVKELIDFIEKMVKNSIDCC